MSPRVRGALAGVAAGVFGLVVVVARHRGAEEEDAPRRARCQERAARNGIRPSTGDVTVLVPASRDGDGRGREDA